MQQAQFFSFNPAWTLFFRILSAPSVWIGFMPGFYYDLCFLCNITAIHGNCKYLLFDWKKTILILSILNKGQSIRPKGEFGDCQYSILSPKWRVSFLPVKPKKCWRQQKLASPTQPQGLFSPSPFKSYVFFTAFCKLSTNFGPKIKNSIFGFSIKKCWRQQKLGHRGQPKLGIPYPHP